MKRGSRPADTHGDGHACDVSKADCARQGRGQCLEEILDEVDVDNDQITILHRGKIEASDDAHSVMQARGFQSLGDLYESLTSAGTAIA